MGRGWSMARSSLAHDPMKLLAFEVPRRATFTALAACTSTHNRLLCVSP